MSYIVQFTSLRNLQKSLYFEGGGECVEEKLGKGDNVIKFLLTSSGHIGILLKSTFLGDQLPTFYRIWFYIGKAHQPNLKTWTSYFVTNCDKNQNTMRDGQIKFKLDMKRNLF